MRKLTRKIYKTSFSIDTDLERSMLYLLEVPVTINFDLVEANLLFTCFDTFHLLPWPMTLHFQVKCET